MWAPSHMHEGDSLRAFLAQKQGNGVLKWSGYLDAYGRHLHRFRSQAKVVMVEVGVQSGGSIDMWRDYFGADKLDYYGVDIDPQASRFARPGVTIVIGDQASPEFWQDFKSTYPIADIFIDDGGHRMAQQLTTFRAMFWHVREGGVYIAEDLHTSYWGDYQGGYRREGTMVELVKSLVDTMHAWHSEDSRLQVDDLSRNIRGMYIYDSMVVLDKLATGPMELIKAGDTWLSVPDLSQP